MEGERTPRQVSIGKPQGNRPLETHRSRENYIKIELKELGYQGVDWIHPAEDRDS
jgi:hypothetical protein